MPVRVSVEVRPLGPWRLPPHLAPDGVMRRRGGVLQRLLHHEDLPIVLHVAQIAPDRVLIAAEAQSEEAAQYGLRRMRFALGLDVDVRPFLRRFRNDPVIGASVASRPWLRVERRPEPFEALAWAICEQLIEYRRAAAIERRIVFRLGRSFAGAGASVLRDLPSAAMLAGVSPALLQSFDLGGVRARALVKAAAEVAKGRVDLHAADHERGWRKLLAIRGIGSWTVERLALHGQGREDQVPAGDVGLLRRVGRLLSDGDPYAFAEERQVRAFFARYGEWAGLAAAHLLTA